MDLTIDPRLVMLRPLTNDGRAMGMKRALGEDAHNFLHDNYKEEINPHLQLIAGRLAELGADSTVVLELAEATAEVTSIAFNAGMKFQETLG